MARKLFFTLQYWLTNPPWDTGVTPPEVYDFLDRNPPGKALDLGCGTGTNVVAMAEYGWQATGVDFVPRAIRKAKRKARRAGVAERTDFFVGDALSPHSFRGEYDMILDIGCFHGFPEEAADPYGRNVSGHLVDGGTYLLYVHINPDPGPGHGASEASLAKLEEYLDLVWRQDGEESERPSAWLKFKKGS